jgi:hypothetical protein
VEGRPAEQTLFFIILALAPLCLLLLLAHPGKSNLNPFCCCCCADGLHVIFSVDFGVVSVIACCWLGCF